MFCGVFSHFSFRQTRTRRRLNKGENLLICLGLSANHGRLSHCRMGIQNCLNFSGIDVEAESDYEIFRTSDNEEVLILKSGEITGIEPSFPVNYGGRLVR